MQITIISAIILITLIVSRITFCANIKCDKRSENIMDASAAKILVVGQKNAKFPENAQQLRVHCNEAKKLYNYINAYANNCMPRFGRETAKLLLLSINKELRIVCKAGRLSAKAAELLRASSCVNGGLHSFQKCNLAMIEAYLGIMNADVKLRIPMSCCHFHKLRECLVTEAEHVKQCTSTTIRFIDNYIVNMLESLLQFLCLQYDESNEKCDQLVRDTPKRRRAQPLPKSILPPVIAIATSIGDMPGPY